MTAISVFNLSKRYGKTRALDDVSLELGRGEMVALIGASGSVAGVIAAYLLLHPRVKIWVLLLFRIPIRLRTVWVLGFWILLQLYNFAFGAPGEISWAAHLGGLLMGTVLVLFFRRPGVPLLARQVDEEMPVDPVV